MPRKIDATRQGQALCIVDMVDCKPMQEADEVYACCPTYDRAWSWFFRNVRPVRPFGVTGQLHLYDVPDDRVRQHLIEP